MTANDVITQVWEQLGDSVEPHRYASADLLKWLDQAEQRVCDQRPDALLTSPGVVATRTTVSALTDELTIGATFRPALIDYVTARAQLREQEQANASRATLHVQLFASEV